MMADGGGIGGSREWCNSLAILRKGALARLVECEGVGGEGGRGCWGQGRGGRVSEEGGGEGRGGKGVRGFGVGR